MKTISTFIMKTISTFIIKTVQLAVHVLRKHMFTHKNVKRKVDFVLH